MDTFKRITIIGLGLIGGSLGLAWKKAGAAREIVGVDTRADICRRAWSIGVVHWASPDLQAALDGAQVVVLAVPVAVMEDVAREVAEYVPENCLVTDVGSTKTKIVRTLSRIFAGRCRFLGGHPMAGSEKAGIDGADPYLFENAAYILTPTAAQQQELAVMENLVGKLGAQPLVLSPEEHDAIVAAVSHLPHVVAAGLVNTVAQVEEQLPQTLMLAAGGFRDTTRIASGSPDLWRGICLSNREYLMDMLERMQYNLETFKELLAAGDGEAIRDFFTKARNTRESIPGKRRGFLPRVFDLVVTVPDRPGVIGSLARLLGDHGINIADIEILRAREGDGGTIRIGVQNRETLDKALKLLVAAGYPVREL